MTRGDDAGAPADAVSDTERATRASSPSPTAAAQTHYYKSGRPFVLSVLVLLIAVGIVLLIPWQPKPAMEKFPPGTLGVNFGVDRSSLTRSIVVSSGSALSPASSVLVARVRSDLGQDSGIKQFPADQITLTATPVGGQDVQIVATLSPMNPEKVGDGLFKGFIDLYTGSKPIAVPLEVWLTPKSGLLATLAFLLLLLGSVLGLSVKWITESLSGLATAYSQWNRLRSHLGDSKSLPDDAAAQLDVISDRIKGQDLDGLNDLFKPLEEDRKSLRAFSTAVEQVNFRIREQELISEQEPHSDVVPVLRLTKVIVDRERARVRKLQGKPWPWVDSNGTRDDRILDDARDLSGQSLIVSIALSAPDQFKDVLYLFQRDCFDAAEEQYLKLEQPEATYSAVQRKVPSKGFRAWLWGHLPHPLLPELLRGTKGGTQWMTERPRAMAGAASVLVVAIVGLQVQYMDSTSFTGSLSDWLTLLLWAAVIELSGVSLLDVVGRLSGARTAPQK